MKVAIKRKAIMEKQAARDGGFLSLGINMTGRRCMVVGGGRIGTRKALILLESGAEVVVIAPEISQILRELTSLGQIDWRQRNYQHRDLEGVFLVIAATSDASLNINIGLEAEDRGALCCVVSSAINSAVLFPAVHVKEGITIAVHSDGHDCRRSKQIRDALGEWIAPVEPRFSYCCPKPDNPDPD